MGGWKKKIIQNGHPLGSLVASRRVSGMNIKIVIDSFVFKIFVCLASEGVEKT